MKTIDRLLIDGTDVFGNLTGWGEEAPFWVFDVVKQDWVTGPFDTRKAACDHVLNIIRSEAE